MGLCLREGHLLREGATRVSSTAGSLMVQQRDLALKVTDGPDKDSM